VEPNINFNKFAGLNKRQPGMTRFTQLRTYKETKLMVARECARLTKPMSVPPTGHTPGNPIAYAEQSHGGRLVSNLLSQLLLILFPPGVPFFKLDLASDDMRAIAKATDIAPGKKMHDALRESFVSLENNATLSLDTGSEREKLQMILMQVIVAGDCCYTTANDKMELIPQDDWVCSRSASGELLEALFRQVYPIGDTKPEWDIPESDKVQGYTVVYTRFYRMDDDKKWTVDRFVGSSVEPFVSATMNAEDLWVHVPYWELTPGEDYGRGPVEESLGDLRTYESGTKIINESATALAKVIFTVRPNGLTKASDVAEAENTEIISGDKEDVGVIQASKVYDMGNFIQFLEGIKRELDITFMMPSVIRREAERVTAEEIRMMANEFEKSKGGTYNTLSKSLQAPVARMLLKRLLKSSTTFSRFKINELLPVVSTGLQGLGRTLELENLRAFLGDASAIPQLQQKLDWDNIGNRLATLRGLELPGLFLSPEVVAQAQETAAMDEAARQAGPDIIKGALLNG
jgi:hypothetical protein